MLMVLQQWLYSETTRNFSNLSQKLPIQHTDTSGAVLSPKTRTRIAQAKTSVRILQAGSHHNSSESDINLNSLPIAGQDAPYPFPRLENEFGPDYWPNVSKPEICFVTCIYGDNMNNTDRVVDVTELQSIAPSFRFFFFTNFPDLETPGWTKIITALPYRRLITHSRYGKFQGWKDPRVYECRYVYYVDAVVALRSETTIYRKLATYIESSKHGIIQQQHFKGREDLLQEFQEIVSNNKDLSSNVLASINWMKHRPNFPLNCTIYLNYAFGYDPKSPYFQKLSNAFWGHYSLETDSWRDRPLWAYMVNQTGIVPDPFPGQSFLYAFLYEQERIKDGGHVYTATDAILA